MPAEPGLVCTRRLNTGAKRPLARSKRRSSRSMLQPSQAVLEVVDDVAALVVPVAAMQRGRRRAYDRDRGTVGRASRPAGRCAGDRTGRARPGDAREQLPGRRRRPAAGDSRSSSRPAGDGAGARGRGLSGDRPSSSLPRPRSWRPPSLPVAKVGGVATAVDMPISATGPRRRRNGKVSPSVRPLSVPSPHM